MRSKSAVIEQPGNPQDIAARIAAADAEARKASAIGAVQEWREVIRRIADGHEPEGKGLVAVGDLARRLRLAPDGVSRAVDTVQRERLLQADFDKAKARLVEIKAREAELAVEIKETQERLRALNAELGEYVSLHRAYPYQAAAVSQVRNENPLLYGAPEAVADRLLAAEGAMSLDTFKGMVPQRPRLEGCSIAPSWST